eukprot:3121748-Pyramimonas_sp.AAC.1
MWCVVAPQALDPRRDVARPRARQRPRAPAASLLQRRVERRPAEVDASASAGGRRASIDRGRRALRA